ncbi:MAG: sulfotransferase [Deltaproteobacteria bacterium]|nr:MAG: sulfotransferase [Deltaproteobacteria bacterium]
MTDQAKKPNLFIVGNPKSGTTALYNFLRQHPEIYMSEKKEPHFFSTDLIKESDDFHGENNIHFKTRTIDDYMALFQKAHEKIRGEASTGYLKSLTAPLAIHRFNPQSKIIIILRNPIDFAYSAYKDSLETCGEYLKTFREAILAEPDRKQGKKLSPRTRSPSIFYYSELVKYTEQVKAYVDLFGENKVKIIIFEDFKTDNNKIYHEVLSFLGVDTNFRVEFRGINKNREVKYNRFYSIAKHPKIIQFSQKIFSENIRQFTKKQIHKIALREQDRKPLDDDLEGYLTTIYYDEVVKISQYLNRDLVSFWGFNRVNRNN